MRSIHHGRGHAAAPSRPRTLTDVLDGATVQDLALWQVATPPEEASTELLDLDRDELVSLSRLLTPEVAARLLSDVSPEAAAHLISSVPTDIASGLLSLLGRDGASRILRLMDEDAEPLLRQMELSHSAVLRGLLAWPEDSAASWMRPSAVTVGTHQTLADAVARSREDPHGLDAGVFVTDGERHLLGWLDPAALVVGEPACVVDEVMVPFEEVRGWTIPPLEDQEEIVRRAHRSPVGVVAVVDAGRLIGVIPRSGVHRIDTLEDDEDSALQGGSTPLGGSYRRASPVRIWRSRVVWLTVLFLAEMYTGTVLRHFEDEIEAVVALSFFVPLLIGTGGNLGTQVTTTIIRAMGTEDLRLRDLGRVVVKELSAGMLLGLSMAVLGFVRAWTLGVGVPVMATVALALLSICLWSSLIASLLPMLLRRLGADPAVVSGPMISTIVDGTGLMIYFTIAGAIVLS